VTTRRLTIEIDPAGVRVLAGAGQLVALVKSMTNPNYAVVWQVVTPAERSVVSWEGSYQVYASATALAWGAAPRPVATTAAAAGHTYALAEGRFTAGTAGLPDAQVGLHNLADEIVIDEVTMVTGGVAEVAEVNGEPSTGPLDAQRVRFGEIAVTALIEQVLVFPASGIEAGTLIDRGWFADSGVPPEVGIVLGAPLAVDLTSITAQTIQYDDTTNAFAPAAATADVRCGGRETTKEEP
jgi:hypothetical protein